MKSRVARATYGTTYADVVDEENPEHLSRRETWYMSAAGLRFVPKAFKGILRKVWFLFVHRVTFEADNNVLVGRSGQ